MKILIFDRLAVEEWRALETTEQSNLPHKVSPPPRAEYSDRHGHIAEEMGPIDRAEIRFLEQSVSICPRFIVGDGPYKAPWIC